MKKLTGREIIRMYLDFFCERGHTEVDSAPLIPMNDPTVLWINAGVAALKKYFDGSEISKHSRITNAQKALNNQIFDDMSLGDLIGSGIIIEIIYVPLIQGRQIVYNYDEVERIRENTKRKGVIARYENRNDVQSSDELNKVGQAYLRYKGSAEINLNVLTYNKDLYKIGQIVHFESPLPELSTDYMVKSKETQIISPGDFSEVFYTYKLVSNFNSENAINYFDNQRNKMVGNIGQGEYITRNIDIENASLIYFDNLGFAEIRNNLLDCELEAPFIL